MICLFNRSRFVRPLSALLLALPPVAMAADFKPAPQEFQQEIARHWALPAGASAGGLTLVDTAPDGTVRVADGRRWYVLRGDQLELPPPPPGSAAGAGYVFIGDTAHPLPVPLSAVRQINHQGEKKVWFATSKEVVILAAAGRPVTELPD